MCTLLSTGCAHAMCDGEAFFLLMRCWANEIRGISNYEIPEFSRNKLIVKPHELKHFKPQSVTLGKHFDFLTRSVPWVFNAQWPSRPWATKTWNFNSQEIEELKKSVLNGSKGEDLKKMIVSTNDIITGLFWKAKAVLGNRYYFHEPIICSVVVSTRPWLPDRIPKNYFANALSFICLGKTRRELIDADLSQVVYWIRETVSKIKKEDFETDLHWYYHMTKNGVDSLHRYYVRWTVPGDDYDCYRFNLNRDLMVSNVGKLPCAEFDFGKGNVSIARFNHQEDAVQLGYFVRTDIEGKNFEFFSAVPEDDKKFYDKYNIKDPNLDWKQIAKDYVCEKGYFFRSYPLHRLPKFNFHALFSKEKHVQFMEF